MTRMFAEVTLKHVTLFGDLFEKESVLRVCKLFMIDENYVASLSDIQHVSGLSYVTTLRAVRRLIDCEVLVMDVEMTKKGRRRYYRLNENSETVSILRQMYFFEVRMLFESGKKLVALGDYSSAIKALTKVVAMAPKCPEPWCVGGVAYSRSKEYEKALQWLEHALKLNPNFVEAWHEKGVVYHELGEYDKALECYDRALEINPHHACSIYNKGLIYVKRNERDKASELFKEAQKIDNFTSNRALDMK